MRSSRLNYLLKLWTSGRIFLGLLTKRKPMNTPKPEESIKGAFDTKLQRPMDPAFMGTDKRAARELVAMLNDPALTGAMVPTAEEMAEQESAISPSSRTSLPPEASAPVAHSAPPVSNFKPVGLDLFFTGRLGVGKDYVAGQIGAKIFGFADPIYYLANYFFDADVSANKNKDLPGMRDFLQTVGQWGRKVVNDKYKYVPARALFCVMIRSLAPHLSTEFGVDWSQYGLTENFWVDGLVRRTQNFRMTDSATRIANTNTRFENEQKGLTAEGFAGWHVMCSKRTWEQRLAAKKIALNSPVLTDISEQFAAALDHAYTKEISTRRTGNMLRVIWNDETAPPPSPRFYTLAQFCAKVAQSDENPAGDLTVTGE